MVYKNSFGAYLSTGVLSGLIFAVLMGAGRSLQSGDFGYGMACGVAIGLVFCVLTIVFELIYVSIQEKKLEPIRNHMRQTRIVLSEGVCSVKEGKGYKGGWLFLSPGMLEAYLYKSSNEPYMTFPVGIIRSMRTSGSKLFIETVSGSVVFIVAHPECWKRDIEQAIYRRTGF